MVRCEKELCGTIWDMNDDEERECIERCMKAGHRPLHVLQELSVINSQVFQRQLHPIHVDEIHRSVTRFQDVLGACERIYKTPIYT